jgi:hypothetical protein
MPHRSSWLTLTGFALASMGWGCGRTSLDVSGAVALDAGPDARTPVQCDSLPDAPVTIGRFDFRSQPNAIAIVPPNVYVGLRQGREIDRVAIAGSAPRPLAIDDYAGGSLVADGTNLFYAVFSKQAEATQSVAAYGLPSGPLVDLENPDYGDPRDAYVTALSPAESGRGGALWLLARGVGPGAYASMLVRTDGVSSVAVATVPDYVANLRVGEHYAAARSAKMLYALPLDGSGASALHRTGETAAVLAAHGDAAFFTDDNRSIARIDLATGASRTIAFDVSLERCGFCLEPAAWADATWLYFVDWAPAGTRVRILRVRHDGGRTETVWAGTGDAVFALAGDACDLYWLVNGPNGSAPVVMRMRKPA